MTLKKKKIKKRNKIKKTKKRNKIWKRNKRHKNMSIKYDLNQVRMKAGMKAPEKSWWERCCSCGPRAPDPLLNVSFEDSAIMEQSETRIRTDLRSYTQSYQRKVDRFNSLMKSGEEIELLTSKISRQKIIGQGSWGKVYKINEGGKSIAVKIYYGEDYRKVVILEYKIMKNLKLANPSLRIPEVYSLCSFYDDIMIKMEYISEKTLYTYIEDSLPKLKNDDCLNKIILSFSQLVDSVHFMHACDISHRDLKLKNIMVETDGEGDMIGIKIIDFNGAVYTTSKVSATMAMGTTRTYAPPEIYSGNYDPKKIDIFSLGVILYELLTRKPDAGLIFAPKILQKKMTNKEKINISNALRGGITKFGNENDIREGEGQELDNDVGNIEAGILVKVLCGLLPNMVAVVSERCDINYLKGELDIYIKTPSVIRVMNVSNRSGSRKTGLDGSLEVDHVGSRKQSTTSRRSPRGSSRGKSKSLFPCCAGPDKKADHDESRKKSTSRGKSKSLLSCCPVPDEKAGMKDNKALKDNKGLKEDLKQIKEDIKRSGINLNYKIINKKNKRHKKQTKRKKKR